MITLRSNKEDEVRFSNAFLVRQWGVENGRNLPPVGRTKAEKAKRQTEKGQREGGRNYKGQPGRISKDGKSGYFDVDSRGRLICV
ncbi:MAG: hypothetical protein FWC41_03250 [Firmicutes bacterium]|nr:hypothetical protein [Bacillota bacterium]